MKKIIYIALLGLIMFSCSDEDVKIETKTEKSQVKTFEDLGFVASDTDNKIIIQSISSPNATNNLYNISSSSKTDVLNFQMNGNFFAGENVYRGENSSNWNQSVDDLSMYFGKEVVFDTNIGLQNRGSSDNLTFYIPQLLSANITNLDNGKITAGSVVTWNLDSLNKKK